MRKRDEDRVLEAVQRKVDEAYRAGYRDGMQAQQAVMGQHAAIAQAKTLAKAEIHTAVDTSTLGAKR